MRLTRPLIAVFSACTLVASNALSQEMPQVDPDADSRVHGMPHPPGRFDTEFYAPLDEISGIKRFQTKLCFALKRKMEVDDPKAGVKSEALRRIYLAAGADPAKENVDKIAPKMKALFVAHGERLECHDNGDGYESAFKAALRGGDLEFIRIAMYDWQLPPEHLNKFDLGDGRNLMDFIPYFAQTTDGKDQHKELKELYKELWAAGARPSRELITRGKLKSIPQMQQEFLVQWRQLANSGNVRAMQHLSSVYRRGEFVPLDIPEGMRWWNRYEQRAIENADQDRLTSIGSIYLQGEMYRLQEDKRPGAIPKDPERAVMILEKANVIKPSHETTFWLGKAYLYVRRDPALAARYFEEAVRLKGGDVIYSGFLATAYIDLGEKDKAAYHLRSLPLGYNVKGLEAAQWFKRLDVSWCGPRSGLPEIKCDGTNGKPPAGLFGS